jgi:hypothetical protein
MSGGPFDWVRGGFAEIASQVNKVFSSDDASGSNSGETQARTNSSAPRERGKASHLQGQDLERYTEQQLDDFGLNALWDKNNLVYDETLEEYGKTTQVDVIIRDGNDDEVALIECKAYTSKWNDVDQARRLVSLANERGIPLVFSTSDGTTDCFSPRVKEVLNETQCFVISPDNIFFAEPSDVKENGVTQGLPPELRAYWDYWFGRNYEPASSDRADLSSYETESSESLDCERSNSSDRGGSWDLFGNLFDDSSDSKSNDSSDSNSSDSGDSGNSWFGGLFGDSSDCESTDSSARSSSDSDSSYSYDSDSSYSSDSGSSDRGDGGGSWDLFGSSYGSESNDSYDRSSSDSDSSYSYDSDSSYSSDSDSSYSSDSGSSDCGSGDDGDSGGSDSSSSSSDSWW